MVTKAGVRKKAVKPAKKTAKKKTAKTVDSMAKYKRKGSTMSGMKYGRRTSPGGRYTSTYRGSRCGKKPSKRE